MSIECHIDGSCEPYNPGGRMGIGVNIKYSGKTHDHTNRWEENPNNSNNLAEYLALEYVLRFIKAQEFKDCEIMIKSDSMLLVNQSNGRWRIKKGAYADKARECRLEMINLANTRNINFKVEWIPREQNEYADNLSKL